MQSPDKTGQSDVQLAYCGAHARRKLYDVAKTSIALNRKNALFAGHEAGTQNWAMLASLIKICKLNTWDFKG